MRKPGVAVGIGALMVLIGLVVLIGSLHLGEDKREFDINPGELYYNYISVGLFPGAKLSGIYQVSDGSSIELYVFSSQDYENYQNGGTAYYITHASGSSGSFDVTVDTGGTYYIVLEHSDAYNNRRQTGSATYKITGTDVVMLVVGALILVIGLVLTIFGVKLRRKEQAEMAKLMTLSPSGVSYFQEPLGPAEPSEPESPTWKPPQAPP